MIIDGLHLTYCTNIHPGESWEDTFENLRFHIPKIKQRLSPDGPLGIGLRLSNEASLELVKEEQISEFKAWMNANQAYTFTFNGFPYGGFHRQVVKDQVHHPDWTTTERRDYTLRLFDILKALLPEGMDGGISTSPLSYKFWHEGTDKLNEARKVATLHMVEVAVKLYQIKQQEGQLLHLDIEPEPDGLLENTQDVLDFYSHWLLPLGKGIFVKQFGLSEEEAASALKEHVRICYDVCHFAVVYEKPEEVFAAFHAQGIKIGKIQISAALKVELPKEEEERRRIESLLLPFAESTYLHQVVAREENGQLQAFNDLPQALETLRSTNAEEWRIHFHVPVFLDRYSHLSSTQEDILEVLSIIQSQHVAHHLEVETYTWEVLPEDVNLDLTHSIIRELQWVKEKMK
ncbi:MAG TPA: metabolite traffic protein EboE [Cyclobacteriaceae bacterium]|nr:metabolite traffic protein EboE [Cyclobacteriaceae bacterium]